MQTIKLKTHVGSDGILKLELPVDVANRDLDVVVVLQPTEETDRTDWLTFIEMTAGSLADDPIVRGDQGVIEIREPIE